MTIRTFFQDGAWHAFYDHPSNELGYGRASTEGGAVVDMLLRLMPHTPEVRCTKDFPLLADAYERDAKRRSERQQGAPIT